MPTGGRAIGGCTMGRAAMMVVEVCCGTTYAVEVEVVTTWRLSYAPRESELCQFRFFSNTQFCFGVGCDSAPVAEDVAWAVDEACVGTAVWVMRALALGLAFWVVALSLESSRERDSEAFLFSESS